MSKWNKRGTDKPIEIFIALFIILAVATMVLKMFGGQLDKSQGDLAKQQMEVDARQKLDSAKNTCNNKCTAALDNNCNLRDIALFCQTKILGDSCTEGIDCGLDVDGDGVIGFSDDIEAVGGCESNVYCPSLVECNCGGVAIHSIKDCVKYMCAYYKSNDVSGPDEIVRQKLDDGDCEESSSTWYGIFDIEGLITEHCTESS